jgi:hypothetical protein
MYYLLLNFVSLYILVCCDFLPGKKIKEYFETELQYNKVTVRVRLLKKCLPHEQKESFSMEYSSSAWWFLVWF